MTGDHGDEGIHGDIAEPIGPFGSSLRQYAVFTLDEDGIVLSWNRGAEYMTGDPADEIIGRPVSIFYTAEEIAAGHPEWLLEQVAALGSHTDEGWRRSADGTWFWAYAVTTALRSSDGRLYGFARIARDDTDTHVRLERSLRQFNDLFDLAPVGIGLFDEHGQVLGANNALCGLLGHQVTELLGAYVIDIIHPEEPDHETLREAFESGSPPHDENVQERSLIRSDGQLVHCELHITRSTSATGDPFWLVVFQDVTDRHQHAESLRYWATHDELTGLPNRAAISELADLERVAVLYCDINNFKRINDSLGQAAGDELLVRMARHLRTHLPEEWTVFRASGDEYVVICPDVREANGIESVTSTVSRLLHTTVSLCGELLQISASIGVAVAGDSGADVEDLARFASAAVLHARRNSPDHISLASPELIDSLDRQVRLESQLREAIDAGGLRLVYQPIVRADGVLVSAEALVRWQHPERGLLAPDVFLPVAERAGLMHDLDLWVLRTALREAASWPAPTTGQQVAVAINLAELVPGTPDFVDTLTGIVAETGIEWSRIVIELVETSMLDLPSRTLAAMWELIERGVRFAVDDFGTGYSSLARLKDLPAQIIKIDRKFVSGIVTDSWDRALVKAVADIAAAMGCSCTAEGVETFEQFDALHGVRVTSYQGWLFSRAVSTSDMCSLIETQPLRPRDAG